MPCRHLLPLFGTRRKRRRSFNFTSGELWGSGRLTNLPTKGPWPMRWSMGPFLIFANLSQSTASFLLSITLLLTFSVLTPFAFDRSDTGVASSRHILTSSFLRKDSDFYHNRRPVNPTFICAIHWEVDGRRPALMHSAHARINCGIHHNSAAFKYLPIITPML